MAKRGALENSYRVSAIDDFGMEEETAQKYILRARSSPQKSKHLQPIHEAHGEILSKETEIAEAERALAAAREARYSSKDKFLSEYGEETDPQVRMATLIKFWNSSQPAERLEFVKRLIQITGDSTDEPRASELSAEHMVEFPDNDEYSYKDITVPPRWLGLFLAQSAADKVTFMEAVWVKSTPAEQDHIKEDLGNLLAGGTTISE